MQDFNNIQIKNKNILFSYATQGIRDIYTVLGFKIKFENKIRFYMQNPEKLEIITKRLINRNATQKTYGLHMLKDLKFPSYFKDEIYAFNLLKAKIDFFILNKLIIPQIEFTLTTKCTLRCKNCTNYIPYIKPDSHSIITINEFKEYIKNLTSAVDGINDLILLGGEPLLLQNLSEYVEVVAKNKKIKNVWITTNGTLLLNNDLINVIKKYNKKITIWISNYSANEELKNKLKHKDLLNQIKNTGADYIYNKDLKWGYVTENIQNYNRTKKQNIDYFKRCLHKCLAIFNDKAYVCPRSGTYNLMNLYKLENDETFYLSETNKKQLRKNIINFYSREYFGACNYCNKLEDNKKPRIIPALQILD